VGVAGKRRTALAHGHAGGEPAHKQPQGSVTMLKRFVLALMVFGFVGAASAADPYVGTWKLNIAKSKYSPGPAPKAVTVVFAEKGADLAIAATGTDGAGKPISTKYSFPKKGGPITYTEGAPASGATVAIKRPNANTIDSASTLNGKEVSTASAVLAADGKSFTRTVKGTNAEGKPVMNTEVYER
jgi:hypothetical protein